MSYNPKFSVGEKIKISDTEYLENFLKNYRFHNKLELSQLAYATKEASVKSISMYHGGDQLYQLENVPGIWHECCLQAIGE